MGEFNNGPAKRTGEIIKHVNHIQSVLRSEKPDQSELVSAFEILGDFLQTNHRAIHAKPLEEIAEEYRGLFKYDNWQNLKYFIQPSLILSTIEFATIADSPSKFISDIKRAIEFVVWLAPEKIRENYLTNQDKLSDSTREEINLILDNCSKIPLAANLQIYLINPNIVNKNNLAENAKDFYEYAKSLAKIIHNKQDVDNNEIPAVAEVLLEMYNCFDTPISNTKLTLIDSLIGRLMKQDNRFPNAHYLLSILHYRYQAEHPQAKKTISTEESNVYDAILQLEQYGNQLEKKGSTNKAKKVNDLTRELSTRTHEFFSKPSQTQEEIKKYKSKCKEKIKEADKTLHKDTGWTVVAKNVVLAITSVGIGYGIAALINKKTSGRWGFFRKPPHFEECTRAIKQATTHLTAVAV